MQINGEILQNSAKLKQAQIFTNFYFLPSFFKRFLRFYVQKNLSFAYFCKCICISYRLQVDIIMRYRKNVRLQHEKQFLDQFSGWEKNLRRKEIINELLYDLKFYEINLKSAFKKNSVNEILNLQKKIDSAKEELIKISKKHS